MRGATLAGAFLRRDFALARTYRASFVLQGFASAFVLVLLFAGLGVAVAAFTMAFKRGTALVGLITGALALLGGVWFPVTLLPGVVRWVAQLLPFTWGVAALRDCLLSGHVDLLRLTGLLVSGLVVLAAALWLFGASVA